MKIHNVDGLPILLHKHHAPFTNVSVRVKVGSAHERLEEYGLAHALEHMMFKGTPSRNDMEIDRDTARLGATNNAGTNYQHTFYWVDARNENWQEAAKILADMFLNASIPEAEWLKEKDVILSEYRRGLDNVRGDFWGTTAEDVFGSLMHSVIGTEESIKSFDRASLDDFRKRWYGKPNVYILAVGDVDEDDPSFFAELFREMPDATLENSKEALAELEAAPLSPEIGSRWKSRPNLQEGRLLAFQDAERFDSAKWVHDDVVTNMLGGGSSALLFERIRKEKGMSCYGLYAYHLNDPIYNAKCIEAGIAPDQMEELEAEIKSILEDFENLITEDRFVISRETMLTSIARSQENVATYAGVLGYYYEMGAEDPVVTRAKYMETLQAMEYSEIVEYAKAVFADKEWHWAHLLPE